MIEIKNRWTGLTIATGKTHRAAAEAAKANLSGADLSGANLYGANLSGANLSEANLSGIKIPVIPIIDAAILKAVQGFGNELEMNSFHTCETTHCRAGWAIHLAGEDGYDLQKRVGPCAAGALIYAVSRPDRPVPDFYATNKDALADIKACTANES